MHGFFGDMLKTYAVAKGRLTRPSNLTILEVLLAREVFVKVARWTGASWKDYRASSEASLQ